jgi:hypothetical protein
VAAEEGQRCCGARPGLGPEVADLNDVVHRVLGHLAVHRPVTAGNANQSSGRAIDWDHGNARLIAPIFIPVKMAPNTGSRSVRILTGGADSYSRICPNFNHFFDRGILPISKIGNNGQPNFVYLCMCVFLYFFPFCLIIWFETKAQHTPVYGIALWCVIGPLWGGLSWVGL